MFCKSRSDSDTFSESISGGRLFNIIADRIINSIITNGAQTAVGFLNSRFRTDSIAEPVNSDRKTDSVAFRSISLKLFVNRIESITCTNHSKLIACVFNPFPVDFSLKFADIKSFYIHNASINNILM